MNHGVNVGRIPEDESDIMGIREKKMNGLEGPMVFNTFTVWE